MIKFLALTSLGLSLMTSQLMAANASRSDSIDIRKTRIELTITDFGTKIIYAKSSIAVRSKLNNINLVEFDLEGLTVDSVKADGVSKSFIYNSPTLSIDLSPSLLQANDSALIDVYYHGVPVADATWGGFSFVGNYAFQMGVGFNADPHSFGRTWHPCFDNFVERCAYEFLITTEDSKAAICNGILLDSTLNTLNNTRTWHWKLDEEIPSYLACLAVSNYVFIHKPLVGNNGTIDALITCEAMDSNLVHGSFGHLEESFNMLEEYFGTYSWPRVGYSLVPFNAGAMEHATNISIGRPFIDGTLNYETLIAHELSHHWWGDLVTCSTAGDMWINEGFASYCEQLHTEYVYGKSEYQKESKANHYNVLNKAHIDDNGYRSVANVDQQHTYGATVYNKGADVLHTLRSYMGDSLFFTSLRTFVNNHKFESVSSVLLRDQLSLLSGINLTPFFDNWIFAPGFTHFSIDSTNVHAAGGDFDVSVFLRQRKHRSTDYYQQVPIELAFYDASMQPWIYNLDFSGRCMQFNVKLPFEPLMVLIDPYSKISDAITEEDKIIYTTGNTVFNQAKCRLSVKSLVTSSDSALFHASHHWVAPDRFKNPANFPGFVLCDSRYWNIAGINLDNLKGTLQFNYDAGINNSYLDSTWLKNTEDSIRLFYRKDASEEWQFANDSLRAGGLNDKVGSIYAKEIKAGQYTFGIKRSTYTDTLQDDKPNGPCAVVSSLPDINSSTSQLMIYPNPVHQSLSITNKLTGILSVELFDAMGRRVIRNTYSVATKKANLDLSKLPAGIYILSCRLENGKLSQHKVVKID